MKTKDGLFRVSIVSAMLLCVSPAIAGDLKEELIAKEKMGWTAWANRDGEAAGALITEDAVHTVAGAYTETGRDKIMATINSHNCRIESFEFSDVKLRQLSPDIAILTYTAKQDATCEEQKLPGSVYATVIYVQEDGEWRWTSYQETALD